jgi:integrin beta 3
MSPDELGVVLVRTIKRALEPLAARLAAVEGHTAALDLRERMAAAEVRLELAGARVAALETRPPVPGPPGPAGQDGLGLQDLAVEQDGHTVTWKFASGDQVKTFPLTFAFLRDCGVYVEGRSYEPGDVVSWGGSLWACQAATTGRPGLVATAAAWRLCVKCGRDGKDGKPGDRGPAGPAGKDYGETFDALRHR